MAVGENTVMIILLLVIMCCPLMVHLFSQFAINYGKLLISSQGNESSVKASTLCWTNLPKDLAIQTALPTEDTMVISNNGQSATVQESMPPLTTKCFMPHCAATAHSANLSVYSLLYVNPHHTMMYNNTVVLEDVVETKVMNDFYQIIQYYMDTNH